MLRSVPEVGTNLGTHSSRENFQADNWLKIVVGRDGIQPPTHESEAGTSRQGASRGDRASRDGALPSDRRIGRVIAVDLESHRQVALFRHRIRSGRGLLEWGCHGY